MYFGSVKFFKHLIITVLTLLIITPIIICIVLIVNLNSNNEPINESGSRPPDYSQSSDKSDSRNEASSETKSEDTTESQSETKPPETSAGETTDITTDVTEPPVSTTTTIEPSDSKYSDLYPELSFNIENITYNKDMGYVYLTFDDGPSDYTEGFLHYLNKQGVKATFFVVPRETEECFQLMKKIVDGGHTIAVHSFSHQYEEIYDSVENYLADFKKAYDLIYDATGVKSQIYRFAGGSKNSYNTKTRNEIIAEMNRRGFIYFDWNVDSNDWRDPSWTQMYNDIIKDVTEQDRSIVLMHDTNKRYNTLLVVEDIISVLKSKGYKFDKLTPSVRPIQF